MTVNRSSASEGSRTGKKAGKYNTRPREISKEHSTFHRGTDRSSRSTSPFHVHRPDEIITTSFLTHSTNFRRSFHRVPDRYSISFLSLLNFSPPLAHFQPFSSFSLTHTLDWFTPRSRRYILGVASISLHFITPRHALSPRCITTIRQLAVSPASIGIQIDVGRAATRMTIPADHAEKLKGSERSSIANGSTFHGKRRGII